MATQVQLRRGTTSQIAAFTGANGEVAVDTDVKTLYLQDGSTAGGFAMARADFSNISGSAELTLATLNATTVNTTSIDLTNLEVTNIKAKDGTAAGSIADSTGVVTIASAVLTTADINGGTFDGVVGGTTPAAGTFTTFTSTGIDDNAASTAFTLDSSNNAGLGTGSPSSATWNRYLHISGQYPGVVLTSTHSGSDHKYSVGVDDTNFIIRDETGSATAMTIDSSQNVVIGSSSALRQLTLYNTGSSLMAISAGTSSHAGVFYYDGSTEMFNQYYDNSSDKYILSSSASANQFVIDRATGNVGIGTASPNNKLQISDSSVGTDPTADDSNFIKLTNKDAGTASEVWGLGFSTESGGTDYLGAFIQALGNYSSNFNHSLIFGTRPSTSGGPVTAMTIDSSQNVGIGTSSPSAALHVYAATGDVGITIETGEDNGAREPFLNLKSYATNANPQINFGDHAGYMGSISYENADDSMRFATNGTEFLRIASSGFVSMGNTVADTVNASSGYGDLAVGDGSGNCGITIYTGTSHGGAIAFADGTSGTDTYRGLIEYSHASDLLGFYTSATSRMQINSTGSIGAPTGTNIYNASDERLKKNITSLSSGSLDLIKSLNPIKFNWIDNFVESENDKTLYGFVAQEVEEIFPDAVEAFGGQQTITVEDQTIENPLSVREKFLIPHLVKAIQEQQTQIEALKSEVAALKGE